jgi:hypothetical protein
MSSKQTAQNKVNAAIKASSEVQYSWNAAMESLRGSVTTNGYGIYSDRSALRNKLVEAKASIDKALQTMSAIDWPTDDDYNKL